MQNNARKIRTSLGLTLDEVAEAIGSTKAQVSKLERGLIRLNDKWLTKLSVVFNCSIHDIIDDNYIEQRNTQTKQLREKKTERDVLTASLVGTIDAQDVGFVSRYPEKRQCNLMFSWPKVLRKLVCEHTDMSAFTIKNGSFCGFAEGAQFVFVKMTEARKSLIKPGSIVLCALYDEKGQFCSECIRTVEWHKSGIPFARFNKKYGRKKGVAQIASLPLTGKDSYRRLVEHYQLHEDSGDNPPPRAVQLVNDLIEIRGLLVKVMLDA